MVPSATLCCILKHLQPSATAFRAERGAVSFVSASIAETCSTSINSSLTARSGGSAFSVNVVVPADKIKIEGPTKTYTKTADSGNEGV